MKKYYLITISYDSVNQVSGVRTQCISSCICYCVDTSDILLIIHKENKSLIEKGWLQNYAIIRTELIGFAKAKELSHALNMRIYGDTK